MDAEILAPMLVIIILTVTAGATMVLRGALGKALAERIAGRRLDPSTGPDPEVRDLRDELDEVRGQLVELQERMDFAERVLAQQREVEKLPRGEP